MKGEKWIVGDSRGSERVKNGLWFIWFSCKIFYLNSCL